MENFFRRSFEFVTDSFDEEKREVMISFSSETENVERWYGVEVLSHKDNSVNLKRLRTVGSLLFAHSDEIIGPIKKVQINTKRGCGEALVGFDETPEGNRRMLQVKNKSLRGVSIDYRIQRMYELQPDEEYQLASKIIKGRKDKPVMIAEKWEPIEISLLPKPADSDVGVGRAFSRSLEGIEINKRNKESKPMEKEEKIEKEQIREIVNNVVKESLKEIIPDIVMEVKRSIVDKNRPNINIEPEIFKDITNRAYAISSETMNKVTNFILEGKTEPEVLRFLNDELIKNTDSNNAGNFLKGKETEENRNQKNKDENIRSFKDLNDDRFWETLKNPTLFTYFN